MQALHFAGLSASEIHLWRGDRHVLRGISFEARTRDLVHVAGPNGAGKSTLLRVCAGLLVPERGAVQWQGRAIAADRDNYSANMSYLGHSDGLKPELTAHENLTFAIGLRRELGRAEIDATLARVGLAVPGVQTAGSLSAGQRRRLAMARVILAQTALWILDEPFTNLDGEGAATMAGIVGGHLDAGGAVVLAAHQSPEIPRHVPRRVELG